MKKIRISRNYLKLFGAGALAVAALPPFYIFPVLFISFPFFFNELEKTLTRKQAFVSGWAFGFGYFVFGLYWIANSLLVDMRFAWLIPFAVAGIPFLLSIYTGLLGIYYHSFSKGLNLFGKVLLFTTLWVVFELIRGWLFTGFPWNLIGYSALLSLTFSQLASLGGIWLLGFVVVLIALLPAYYKSKALRIGGFALIVAGFAFGTYHFNYDFQHSDKIAKVLIFQPNVKQELKWDPVASRIQFVENVQFTKKLNYKDKDIILWPESGVPYYLNAQPWVIEILRAITPEKGLMITGGLRSEGETMADYKVWNTLYAVADDRVYQSYDKIHLVPFGEFVPFRKYLPLDKITPGSTDFSRGKSRDLIKYNDGPSFLSLICYEVIFPEYSASPVKPDLLINVTNDGWFGNSTGPYQHLATAQMRSIEQGVPLLRAANTGVSAIINPNGKIVNSIPYGKKDFIETELKLNKADTIYSAYGNSLIFIIIFVNFVVILISYKKRQTSLA